MTAIASWDEMTQILTGGLGAKQTLRNLKQFDRIGAAAAPAIILNRLFSTWQLNNNYGGGGAAPGGSARQCTNATQGAVPFTSPTGGREKFLAAWEANSVNAGEHTPYDRLCDISGFSGTQTGSQAVSLVPASGAATVDEALENEICIDIYGLLGTTASTIVVGYLDANGVAGVTPAAVLGGTNNREVHRKLFLPFEAGKRGVTEITSRNLAASTLTVGDYGISIVKKVAPSAVIALGGYGTKVNMLTQFPSMVKMRDNACIEFVTRAGAASFSSESEYGMSFLER